MNVVAFAAPMAGAALADVAGIPLVLLLAAGCLLACALLLGLWEWGERRKALRVTVA
jgi:uncharacterized iron-regulated membrane protein